MASTKENGAVAAAEPFGSLSLDESAERKESDTEPTTKSGTNATKKLCSACGEKSNTLKKCNGCLCVWYCDKKCQNKHRKEHKKECRLIKKVLDERGGKLDVGKELYVGPFGKLPPQEECPICMHVLPLSENLRTYAACCGKTMCGGCDLQHKTKNKGRSRTCAFCRTAAPESDGEILEQLRKRVELKDPAALINLAMAHGRGELGLPVNQATCVQLLRQAAGLDCPAANFLLGNFHKFGDMGLEQNDEEALKRWKEAAAVGYVDAQHNLGYIEASNGDYVAAMRHLRLSASGGFKPSMGGLIGCFENGFLHHRDLPQTLQVFYRSRAEMRSKERDLYIGQLKTTGEYEENMDF